MIHYGPPGKEFLRKEFLIAGEEASENEESLFSSLFDIREKPGGDKGLPRV